MYSFPNLEPVCCSMSSSNCCLLTCLYVSQEASQVVWYSHLFQNFPQFIVIHLVKGFGIVNKAEVDVSVELSCFFHDPADVGNLISGSSAFSKTNLNIVKFMVHVLQAITICIKQSSIICSLFHCLYCPVQYTVMVTKSYLALQHCLLVEVLYHSLFNKLYHNLVMFFIHVLPHTSEQVCLVYGALVCNPKMTLLIMYSLISA